MQPTNSPWPNTGVMRTRSAWSSASRSAVDGVADSRLTTLRVFSVRSHCMSGWVAMSHTRLPMCSSSMTPSLRLTASSGCCDGALAGAGGVQVEKGLAGLRALAHAQNFRGLAGEAVLKPVDDRLGIIGHEPGEQRLGGCQRAWLHSRFLHLRVAPDGCVSKSNYDPWYPLLEDFPISIPTGCLGTPGVASACVGADGGGVGVLTDSHAKIIAARRYPPARQAMTTNDFPDFGKTVAATATAAT